MLCQLAIQQRVKTIHRRQGGGITNAWARPTFMLISEQWTSVVTIKCSMEAFVDDSSTRKYSLTKVTREEKSFSASVVKPIRLY